MYCEWCVPPILQSVHFITINANLNTIVAENVMRNARPYPYQSIHFEMVLFFEGIIKLGVHASRTYTFGNTDITQLLICIPQV